MDNIFTFIYENNLWGNNGNDHYSGSSGDGSSIDFNIDTYVPFLKHFITVNKIKTVVDLGCGDFLCGKAIYDNLDVTFTGYDTYKKIIDYLPMEYPMPKYNFIHADFYTNRDVIIGGDLCILKDVLQHWNLYQIYNFLDHLIQTKKFKFILICNCCDQKQDNTDFNNNLWRPLCCDYFPLKKYNAIRLYRYHSKEVSLICL